MHRQLRLFFLYGLGNTVPLCEVSLDSSTDRVQYIKGDNIVHLGRRKAVDRQRKTIIHYGHSTVR